MRIPSDSRFLVSIYWLSLLCDVVLLFIVLNQLVAHVSLKGGHPLPISTDLGIGMMTLTKSLILIVVMMNGIIGLKVRSCHVVLSGIGLKCIMWVIVFAW